MGKILKFLQDELLGMEWLATSTGRFLTMIGVDIKSILSDKKSVSLLSIPKLSASAAFSYFTGTVTRLDCELFLVRRSLQS